MRWMDVLRTVNSKKRGPKEVKAFDLILVREHAFGHDIKRGHVFGPVNSSIKEDMPLAFDPTQGAQGAPKGQLFMPFMCRERRWFVLERPRHLSMLPFSAFPGKKPAQGLSSSPSHACCEGGTASLPAQTPSSQHTGMRWRFPRGRAPSFGSRNSSS